MFKKLLAGLGIDGAKVDFIVHQQRVELGGVIDGKILVKGGTVDQEINEITIALVVTSRYKAEDGERKVRQKIAQGKVANQLYVKANAPEISLPVQFKMPFNIPISTYSTKYHFETSLDIKNAVDATDVDDITIQPNDPVQCILDALTELGFRAKPHSGDYNGKCQQFEYVPTRFMRGKLDELELYLEAHEDRVNIMLQIDKKAKGLFANLADDLDLDERHVFVALTYQQISNTGQVVAYFKDLIEREYAKISY